MQRLSEEDIERYMEMKKEELCGDGKRERYIEMTNMKSQTDGDNYKDEKKK